MWFKKKAKKKKQANKCFIVTCHGWSGSHWFSHVLNTHPDLLCTHSASNLNSQNKDLHSLEQMKLRSIERYRNIKTKLNRSVDDYYSEIIASGEAEVYGSVHLFQIQNLIVLKRKFGEFENDYQVVNQVRHPVSFVWSGYGQLLDLFKFDVWVIWGTLSLIFSTDEDYFLDLSKKFDLNLADFDVMAFVGACANLTNLGMDVEVNKHYDFKFVPMEKLTSDRSYFSEIFEYLTSIEPDQEYLDQVFNLGQINKHKDGVKLSPEDRYNSWEPWRKDVFKFYLKKAGLRTEYEKLGYNFEFVND